MAYLSSVVALEVATFAAAAMPTRVEVMHTASMRRSMLAMTRRLMRHSTHAALTQPHVTLDPRHLAIATHARTHSVTKPDAQPNAAVATRTILLGAKPWANVTVDGGPAVETPARVELTIGTHQAVFTNPELAITKRVTITVTETSDARFVVDLSAP